MIPAGPDAAAPGKPKGGGGIPGKPGGGGPNPAACCSIGFACPSAAYEEVIESMTDCAFSWPISIAGQIAELQ